MTQTQVTLCFVALPLFLQTYDIMRVNNAIPVPLRDDPEGHWVKKILEDRSSNIHLAFPPHLEEKKAWGDVDIYYIIPSSWSFGQMIRVFKGIQLKNYWLEDLGFKEVCEDEQLQNGHRVWIFVSHGHRDLLHRKLSIIRWTRRVSFRYHLAFLYSQPSAYTIIVCKKWPQVRGVGLCKCQQCRLPLTKPNLTATIVEWSACQQQKQYWAFNMRLLPSGHRHLV